LFDADAQAAALYKGNLPYRAETGDGYVTWIFSTAEARDHFVTMVHFAHHARPITRENSN
jgi:hypothetical protein